jgi:hypothetical protein
MTLTLPNVALGRSDLTSATITMQDVSAAGVLSNDATGAKTITPILKSVEMNSENELEDTSASTSQAMNNSLTASETM